MRNKKTGNSTLSSFVWKFSERILAQIVTTIVSIVLARVLDPEHYGTIAIVMIFITVANVFVGDGIGSSLVQKKDADELDFSTLLIFNILFSVVLYFVIYFCSPFIAKFYGQGYEILVPVLRVLGIRIIFTGINAIQSAYISRKMMFQKFFWSTLVGTIVSAFVGIYMAYNGFGVWALVWQYLTNTAVNTLMMAIVIGKVPQIGFSLNRLKRLLNFGVKILGTNLLGTLYNQIRAIIIGKVYTSSDLAFFDKGQQFPSLIINNINTSIVAVIFPRMSQEQDNIETIKQLMKKSIRLSTYIISPLLFGLFAVSSNFVTVLLTEKWLACVPLLKMLCLYYLFWPIHSLNMQTIKALGRGNVYLRIEFIKKFVDVIILLVTFKISVEAMTIGMVFSSIISVFINAYPNQKIIGYSVKEQILDILPPMIYSSIMAAIVYFIGKVLPFSKLLVLIIQIITGIALFLTISVVSRNKEFRILLNIIKKIKKE